MPCIVVDRITQRQQPRGHTEDLEAEITNLRERVRQLELDVSARDSELASLKQANGIPPAPSPGIEAATLDSDHRRVRPDGPVTRNESSRTSPLLAQVILAQVSASQEIAANPEGPRTGQSHSGPPGATETADRPSVSSLLPPHDTAEQLIEAYFTLRWPALPVLHKPTFMKQHYTDVIQLGNSASHVSIFLSFMVFALASIDTKEQELTLQDAHLDFFDVAMQHISGLFHSNNLETVQGLLLMTVFAVNERRRINSWHAIGLAVRTAIDLGLHRASTSSSSNNLTTEMQRRVFWSVYALDRNISISLGRPCSISDADFDMPLPGCYSDEDLETGATPLEGRPRSPRDLSAFLHIVELRQIQSRIQKTFYPIKFADATDPERLEQERQSLRLTLDDWITRAPRYSKPTPATFQSPDWFQIAYSHGLLLLYRPSPACPMINLESLQICADSAISLIGSYSSLYAKNKITYTWIALQSLFMASVTMLYTLWVSPQIRKSTKKVVVQSNVRSCLALFDAMEHHWPLSKKFYSIIDRLGQAAVGLFDPSNNEAPSPLSTDPDSAAHFRQIDAEYMEWFGTRNSSHLQVPPEPLNATPSGVDDLNAAIETVLSDPDLGATSFNQADLFPDSGDWFREGFDMTIPLMTNAFSDRPL